MCIDIKDLAAMSMETIYVIDFQKCGFNFVADRNFFLGGHSVEEAISLGYDFYAKVVHSSDLKLLHDILEAIRSRLCQMNNPDIVNYFSFAVRFQYEFGKYQMVYHKLKPKFVDGKLRFGICMLSSSTLKTSGDLRVYDNDGISYEKYLPFEMKWEKRTREQLTKREKTILKLVKQGKSYKDIAEILGIKMNTLQNERSSIYEKLGVDDMMQAVNYATHHHLIYGYDRQKTEEQIASKRTRKRITPDMRLRIQDSMDKGRSLRAMAKREGISESAIRYAIRKGKLKK